MLAEDILCLTVETRQDGNGGLVLHFWIVASLLVWHYQRSSSAATRERLKSCGRDMAATACGGHHRDQGQNGHCHHHQNHMSFTASFLFYMYMTCLESLLFLG